MNEQERRTLLAVVLMLATYFTWSYFFPPPKPAESASAVVGEGEGSPVVPAAPSPVAAPVAAVESCTQARTPLKNSDVRLEISDCGGVYELEFPEVDAPMVVTPWWTWLWSKVSGAPGGWTPYTPAGTRERLLSDSGEFALMGAGDPLSAPKGRWQVSGGDGLVTSTFTTPSGLVLSRTISQTDSPDLLQVTLRWEAPAGAQGPFWVGLHDQLSAIKSVYDPHTQVVGVVDGSIQQLKDPASAKELVNHPGPVSWMGIEDRYYLAALLPEDAAAFSAMQVRTVEGSGTWGWMVVAKDSLAPGERLEQKFNLYLGPKDVERLVKVGGNLDKAAALGFFGFFSKILLFFLHLFQSVIPNWGLAIIALTFFVRASLYPLAARSFKNAKAMQMVQPELKALQEKYAEDKETLNREMMKLFAEKQVNPVGGCLPMFIQMPVFFSLYSALQVTPDLYHQSFLYLQDLSAPDPLGIFPAFMAAGMVIQQRMTPMTGMDPVQQRMMRFMPLMFALFMFTVPAGLAVYYAVNTGLSILQQWYNTRSYANSMASTATRG